MLFTTEWLANHFSLRDDHATNVVPIHQVVTDSRIKTTNSLFIPIVGEKFNGHDFAEDAIYNGAVALFWQEDQAMPKSIPEQIPVFLVKDTLKALHQLAAIYRDKVDPIVIGITGSNGKTTTKDIVSSIVQTTFKTHFTHGNLNNHIGLPLTVLDMPNDTEVLVLEMGMNHFGEIELLSQIAKPDYAIITNIGESHIEYLGSREGIAKAKLEIISGMSNQGTLIIDGDEPLLNSYHDDLKVIHCGYNDNNDVIISQVYVSQDHTTFMLDDQEHYKMPLLGKHHAKNATFGITVGKCLNISHENIQKGLAAIKITGMRFELLKGKQGSFIINDAYNASPTSMKASIDVVKQMEGFQEKVLVLGDILELGQFSEAMHRKIAEDIDDSITAVLTYGEKAKYISLALAEASSSTIVAEHFESKEQLLSRIEQFLKPNSLILFKASRGMEFENLVQSVVI